MVMRSTADEIKKLAALRDEGLLSDEEFQAQKVLVLDQPPPLGAMRMSNGMASGVVTPSNSGVQTVTPSREGRLTPLRWVNLAALLGGVVGLLMPWATAFIASISGLDTDDGKFFGAVLLLAGLLTWWRIARTNRFNGPLLIIVWLGLLIFGVAEIIHVSSNPLVNVGTGLYVDAVAGAVGTVTAAMDTGRCWSRRS
jgi:hypothetical protein